MLNTKPFHESIVDAIDNCTGPGEEAKEKLTTLGDLIINTKIPKNHIVIWAAFERASNYWGDGVMDGLLSKVSEKLREEQNT